MPPDTLTISLPNPLADKVRAAAEARGLSPEEYVQQTLTMGLVLPGDAEEDWEADDLRRLEEAGEDTDAAIVFAELRDSIDKARHAQKP